MNIFPMFHRLFRRASIRVSAASLKGSRHAENEDRIAVNGSICTQYDDECGNASLITLFDGMSGESMGAQCAEAAAALTPQLYKELRTARSGEKIRSCFDRYTNSANAEICRILSDSKVSRGGSTFAAVFISGGRAYPFSLGDSRIYLCNGDELIRISSDHTVAARKAQNGLCTQEEADSAPDSNKLTLYLGLDAQKRGITAESYAPMTLTNGMKLLLCSDGVYDVCTDSMLLSILRSSNHPACDIAKAAQSATNGDDISAAVISVE